jgi:hypothetical protein
MTTDIPWTIVFYLPTPGDSNDNRTMASLSEGVFGLSKNDR